MLFCSVNATDFTTKELSEYLVKEFSLIFHLLKHLDVEEIERMEAGISGVVFSVLRCGNSFFAAANWIHETPLLLFQRLSALCTTALPESMLSQSWQLELQSLRLSFPSGIIKKNLPHKTERTCYFCLLCFSSAQCIRKESKGKPPENTLYASTFFFVLSRLARRPGLFFAV